VPDTAVVVGLTFFKDLFDKTGRLPRRSRVSTKGSVMSKQRAKGQWRAQRAEIVAAFLELREDEILDAVVSAAAVVARADGWVQEVERNQMLDFVDREGLLSIFAREDAVAHFERCVREVREPGGSLAVIARLGRHRASRAASLVVKIGEEVAAADCRLDPREQQVLRLIASAVEGEAR